MYSISKASEITGLSPHTLRYYEKIGLLPRPERKTGGGREYEEFDISFIQCLVSLKKIGMTLEEMQEFIKDGCILKKVKEGEDIHPSLEKRIFILRKHLAKMEEQRRELDQIIFLTKEKMQFYASMMEAEEAENEK